MKKQGLKNYNKQYFYKGLLKNINSGMNKSKIEKIKEIFDTSEMKSRFASNVSLPAVSMTPEGIFKVKTGRRFRSFINHKKSDKSFKFNLDETANGATEEGNFSDMQKLMKQNSIIISMLSHIQSDLKNLKNDDDNENYNHLKQLKFSSSNSSKHSNENFSQSSDSLLNEQKDVTPQIIEELKELNLTTNEFFDCE
jgi:hypothetical protein